MLASVSGYIHTECFKAADPPRIVFATIRDDSTLLYPTAFILFVNCIGVVLPTYVPHTIESYFAYKHRLSTMPGIFQKEEGLKIAVIGGGIAGVTLALGLLSRNINVCVYERG